MKKIIKSICFSLLAFMFAIGSIFLPVGKQNQKYANADTTSYSNVTFYSSDILSNYTPYYSTQYYDFRAGGTDTAWEEPLAETSLMYSFCINYQPLSVNYNPSIFMGLRGRFNNSYYLGRSDIQTTSGISSSIFSGETGNYWGVLFDDSVIHNTSYIINVSYRYYVDNVLKHTVIGVGFSSANSTSSIPSLKMVSVEIGSSVDALSNNFAPLEFYDSNNNLIEDYHDCNIIKYTDTNGFEFYYYLPCYAMDESGVSLFYSYRKYLLEGAFDFSDNSYYQQGLADGKTQGYDTGYNEGYSYGSSVGYDDGFENGKIQGALESNNYSFFGLISAIIDAPVKILTSLFNFNFLGVNLWAFFTSILTISLIVFVIRKFMAKG